MAAYWGWYGNQGDTSAEGIEKAIRKYAQVIVDSINKYDYDGFDIDYEPNFSYGGNISSYSDRMHILLDELSKSFGPKSGTGRILMVSCWIIMLFKLIIIQVTAIKIFITHLMNVFKGC